MLFILCAVIALVALGLWRGAVKRGGQGSGLMSRLLGPIAGVFGLFALFQCFTVIPAGNVGVIDFFGTVTDRPITAGINFVNPLAQVIKFSTQTQEHKESMQVLSREGLTIGLELSCLYRLNPDSAARVYKTIIGGTMRPSS